MDSNTQKNDFALSPPIAAELHWRCGLGHLHTHLIFMAPVLPSSGAFVHVTAHAGAHRMIVRVTDVVVPARMTPGPPGDFRVRIYGTLWGVEATGETPSLTMEPGMRELSACGGPRIFLPEAEA